MSHLDQFSIDHFTSPWQVKRQCDVPTHSRALTSIPVESCNFDWSIPDFSSQQESVQSANFGFSENNQLEFFLRMNLHSKDKIWINLCFKKSVDRETRILVQISIMDKDGHKCFTADGFVKLFEGELEYECVKPLENDYFNANGLVKDDTLRMCCEFKLVGDATCISQIVEPIPKVLPELNSKLTNRQASDVVFNFINGNQLHAHRSILCSRSPVFFGMFQHDTIEAQLGQVDITDVGMEVCELMLRYIYTGMVELDQTWTLDLMIAADKYQLNELKDQCEEKLSANISLDNIEKCLNMIDTIKVPVLKTKTFEYFHSNFKHISRTNILQHLRESAMHLLLELYPELQNDLQQSSTECNVVLHFDNGKQLHAHHSILSSRSPVFFGMFQPHTIETQLGQVDITDVDIKVFEIMLQYIYTGLVEPNQEWTLDLMIAADKYELTELKDQCEDWLCTNLSIESVTDCLVWSDQIGATKLKKNSIEFFHR